MTSLFIGFLILVVWRSCVNPGRTICEHRMWVELLWLIICWATLSDHHLLQVKIFIVRRFCHKRSKVWQILPRRSQTSASLHPQWTKVSTKRKSGDLKMQNKTFVASKVKVLTLKIQKKLLSHTAKASTNQKSARRLRCPNPHLTSHTWIYDIASCRGWRRQWWMWNHMRAMSPSCLSFNATWCHVWHSCLDSADVFKILQVDQKVSWDCDCFGFINQAAFSCLQPKDREYAKFLSKTYLSQNTQSLFFFGDVAALPKRCLGLWRWGILLPLMLLVMIDKLTQKYL